MNKKAETETQAGLGTTDIIKTHYLTNEKNTIQTVKGQMQNLSIQISFATSLGGGGSSYDHIDTRYRYIKTVLDVKLRTGCNCWDPRRKTNRERA